MRTIMKNIMKHFVKIAVPLTFTAALLVSCSDMFQERVSMQTGSAGSTLLAIFETRTTIDTLPKPAQIFVTSGEYKDKVLINWSKVEGARSYCLERAISYEKDAEGKWKTPDEGEYETVSHSSFIEGTSFTDTIIDNTPANTLDYTNEAYQKAYFYRVCAENKIENYESSEFAYTDSGTMLTPPTNLKATGGKYTDKIVLSWKKAPGTISSYRIYRSLSSDGSGGSQIATVYGNLNTYTLDNMSVDEQGVNYYFSLVSVGSSGSESVSSSIALGYALKPGAPGEVEDVAIDVGRGETTAATGISLSWKPASGGTGTIYYNVYKYSASDSSQKIVKSGITDTSCTDTKALKPNNFYYYLVQAYCINSSGETLTGPMSDSGDDSNKPAEGYLLSPPQTVMVRTTDDTTSNNIVFSAAIGSADCESNTEVTKKKQDYKTYTYIVYGCDTASGTFEEIKLIDTPTPEQGNPGYYIEKVPAYKFYRMATKNGSLTSDLTAIIAPAPFAAKDLSVTKNQAIPGYTDNDVNANANGVHAVKITWSAPDGGADGGYNIYRSAKPNSGFKKINESPLTETSFIYKDEQAKAGNYYYYRVLSLNSLGQGANYSNTDHGYGALTTYQYVREYIKTTLSSQKKLTLMHKSGNTDKLGSESAKGEISGTLSYDASIAGLGGRVIMHYTNYADFYIMNDSSLGVYFLLDGNTNTSAGMDTNGTMDGTVTVKGMYPGSVVYDNIKIKGGAAGGGTYGVTRTGIDSSAVQADWTWGEK